MPIKLVHAADFHMESTFKGLGPAKAELRRAELKQAFAKVIDLAAREQAQLLLLAGDLFEHGAAGRELMHFLDQGFRKLQARVFITPGNHDPGLVNSPYWSYPWHENVHIFRERVEGINIDELNCTVYGLGFAHFAIKQNLLKSFKVENPARVNIMLFHGEDKSIPVGSGESNYLPFSVADLAQGGADYYAIGHNHRPRVVWEDGVNVKACYAGSPEPLGYDEGGEHGVFCGTVDKGRNNLKFVKLNERSYRTQKITCRGEEYLADLVKVCLDSIPEAERSQDFVKLVFAGEVDPGLEFHQAKMEELLEPYFFHCKVENQTIPRYDVEHYDPRTARGMFAAKINAMLAGADREEDKEVLRQTLLLGLDALNLGKVVER
ncbi:MAG TPA: DNA repair exonuclease [Verrucomicrobiae bacterium]|nr:DNA repair exonuclease [Verrucomicrobiae bacterium]